MRRVSGMRTEETNHIIWTSVRARPALALIEFLSSNFDRRQQCRNGKWLISTTVRLVSLPPHSYLIQCSAEIGAYSYGLGHIMKPQRMRITHELITAYDMLDKMHIIVSLNDDSHYSKMNSNHLSGLSDVHPRTWHGFIPTNTFIFCKQLHQRRRRKWPFMGHGVCQC
jgi:hypothetical protein